MSKKEIWVFMGLGCVLAIPIWFNPFEEMKKHSDRKHKERILEVCLQSGNYTIEQCVSLVEKKEELK